MPQLGGCTTAATPAYAASLLGGGGAAAPETAIPEEYHIYDPDMPRGPSHGCTARAGTLLHPRP